jgi:hypothetical protein
MAIGPRLGLLRVCGYRDAPFGIRMRVSSDDGRTWSAETTIRSDGGTADPLSSRREARSSLAVYYFNDGEGEERYIAASIVTPSRN